MTIDVCPFITENQNVKLCPGCIIIDNEVRVKGQEAVISNCLKGIKEEIDAAIRPFLEFQSEVYSVYGGQGWLEFDVLVDTIEYLDEFFAVISDPERVRRRMERRCRRPR